MKLKYVLYMAAALSLTGCNDSFSGKEARKI